MLKLDKTHDVQKKSITVGHLFQSNKERLKLKQLNGQVGFEREIVDKNIHRPGLALAGYVELFTFNRVQIFGNTEMKYLDQLKPEERHNSVKTILGFDIPCIVVTNDNRVDKEILDLAATRNVPIFQTPLETTKFVYLLGDYLDDQFSPQTTVHGSFVDVYGIGVLIVGRSGIGKSEVALDLVERGHRLVADDVVMITRKGENILMGAGTDLVKHFMEIRGLGLIDVRSMFGIRAIRFQKRVEIVVELEDWKHDEEYTRTGLDNTLINIMDVEVMHVRLPIFPGKNVTVICEVIALNYLLKHYGYDAAKAFARRLEAVISEKSKNAGTRVIDYFEHDFE
jgi:HPr kinase/phosphorylase